MYVSLHTPDQGTSSATKLMYYSQLWHHESYTGWDSRSNWSLAVVIVTLEEDRGEAIMLINLSIILFSNSHNFAYYSQ